MLTDVKSNNNIIKLWKNKVKNLPLHDKFVEILRTYSSKDFEQSVNTDEWEIVDIKYNPGSFCICSHDITEEIYIKSRYNGNILRVGNTCIESIWSTKHDIIDQAKTLLNQFRYKMKSEDLHRPCMSCGKHKISINDPEFKKVCKQCYRSGLKDNITIEILNGKKCKICKKRLLNTNDWRNKCIKCFKYTVNNGGINKNCRKCIKCGNNLSVHYELWKKLCYTCYIKK